MKISQEHKDILKEGLRGAYLYMLLPVDDWKFVTVATAPHSELHEDDDLIPIKNNLVKFSKSFDEAYVTHEIPSELANQINESFEDVYEFHEWWKENIREEYLNDIKYWEGYNEIR